MGPPHDAYVYHYSFDRSCFVVVVCMLFTTQLTEVEIPVFKSNTLMKSFQQSRRNIHNLDSRVSSFLMSTRNATHNIKKEPLYEENSTLLEVQVKC